MKSIKNLAGTLTCLVALCFTGTSCTNTNNRDGITNGDTNHTLDIMNPEPADTTFSEEEIDPNQTDIEGGHPSSFDRDKKTGADTAKTVRPQPPRP